MHEHRSRRPHNATRHKFWYCLSSELAYR